MQKTRALVIVITTQILISNRIKQIKNDADTKSSKITNAYPVILQSIILKAFLIVETFKLILECYFFRNQTKFTV